MKKKVLIAGASRGIGLELAVQYAAEDWDVIACCRNVEEARRWLPASVDLQPLDITSAQSITDLAERLGDVHIDLLISCAAEFGPGFKDFYAPTDEEFDLVMHTNTLGPLRLFQAFGESVVKAQGTIVALSSVMGSIADTESVSGILYRCSKAALNMVMKLASCDYGRRGATVVSLDPGWVRTDMGGPNAPLSVSESVENMRGVIAGLKHACNGCFFDHQGKLRSW